MEDFDECLALADAQKQDDLAPFAEVDPMEGEQTWPTQEEIREAEEANVFLQLQKKVKKQQKEVDHQTAWIIEEEQEDDEEDYGEDSDGSWEDASDEDEVMTQGEDSEREDFDGASVVTDAFVNDEQYDDCIDQIEEEQAYAKFQAERENEQFPDEIDTPMDIPARERFQRYRGLKSFRTSPWDPKENLPIDYAKIFQFQNFQHSKNRALKSKEDNDCVAEGSYVTVSIKNVPRSYAEGKRSLTIITGLLQHEQKMTVMHYVTRKHPTYSLPVQSKEQLIFHVGHRQFTASPIFSQHTSGDKFKSERFLPGSDACVMSVYAPVTYPSCPVLVFDKDYQLISSGSVLKSDPNRIVTKKIVLSGHPYKINKKSVVVRYMFFNRDDILWFKPVELFTKYGRRGNIKEPLGTQGHMKCVFDGGVKAQDTICMNLYKRIFPRWDYKDYSVTSIKTETNQEEMDVASVVE